MLIIITLNGCVLGVACRCVGRGATAPSPTRDARRRRRDAGTRENREEEECGSVNKTFATLRRAVRPHITLRHPYNHINHINHTTHAHTHIDRTHQFPTRFADTESESPYFMIVHLRCPRSPPRTDGHHHAKRSGASRHTGRTSTCCRTTFPTPSSTSHQPCNDHHCTCSNQ